MVGNVMKLQYFTVVNSFGWKVNGWRKMSIFHGFLHLSRVEIGNNLH